MKVLEIKGQESATELIKQLVCLRLLARQTITTRKKAELLIQHYRDKQAAAVQNSEDWRLSRHLISALEENSLNFRFHEIEIGQYLMHLCHELDKKAPRELIFEAINTNKADRDTEEVRKYGEKSHHLICILDLENSATLDDEIEIRPLKWCHTMAMMNAMQTNEKLGKAIHDISNEFFDGAFGEYRETPLMERLAGRAV